MKLDRNVTGHNKYAVIDNRKLQKLLGTGAGGASDDDAVSLRDALAVLEKHGLINWGTVGSKGEFFVLMLKDAFAEGPLIQYANTAMIAGEKEYAQEVINLANRSGQHSPFCKRPD